MLEALIFDFDGVVVDSEPIHLAGFRAVLQEQGIGLSTQEYYQKYIGYDDHDCFAHVLADNGRAVDEALIAKMTAGKSALVRRGMQSVQPLAGAIDLMRAARAGGAGVAICSGALRAEIEIAGAAVGALALVDVLVSANDVLRGKPDPEGYLKVLALLGQKHGRPVAASRTWVIEDAPAGIDAAKAAGCKVLAVTNSYAGDALSAADKVVDSLAKVSLAQLQ